MIKGTPSKNTRLYLYSSVVLPLKKLNVDFPVVQSPFIDKESGRRWLVDVIQEPVREQIRHNYQRDRQDRVRNNVVVIYQEGDYNQYPLAYYDKTRHWVKLYEVGFKRLKIAHLLGQFYEAFDSYTPFTKVIIDSSNSEYMKLTQRMGVDISRLPY